jgi:pimeloyl-ACP methyl ester carboxylesterase
MNLVSRNILLMTLAVFLPSFFLTNAGRAGAFNGPESQFFDVQGVKIHYLVQGSGEPVVLIHGLDSSAGLNWILPGTMAYLAKNHQVIALDLPGYGKSDKPDNAAAYGRQWVTDIIMLLDHMGIRKAHIVGYSMGGMIALKLIAEHPGRVLSGTLGGMGWMPEGSGFQKIWAHMRKPSASGAAELALTEDQVRSIKVPIEIIAGTHDPIRAMYIGPLEKIRPDWQVIDIQGAGHITCIMRDQFKEELARWIDRNG